LKSAQHPEDLKAHAFLPPHLASSWQSLLLQLQASGRVAGFGLLVGGIIVKEAKIIGEIPRQL